YGITRRNLLRGAAATGLLTLGGATLASCQRPDVVEISSPRPAARLGFLAVTSAAEYARYTDAFRAGLRELGRVEGSSITIDERCAEGREELLPQRAADLVSSGVDVLVTASTQASLAAIGATSSIPIVFFNSGDPVGSGLVQSLARPGGNATGLTSLNAELAGKRLELLRVASPNITRVAALWADAAERDVNETRAAAFWLGLQVDAFRVTGPDDLQCALDKVREVKPD